MNKKSLVVYTPAPDKRGNIPNLVECILGAWNQTNLKQFPLDCEIDVVVTDCGHTKRRLLSSRIISEILSETMIVQRLPQIRSVCVCREFIPARMKPHLRIEMSGRKNE